MSNGNENSDVSDSQGTRRQVPENLSDETGDATPEPSDGNVADFDCPENAPEEAFYALAADREDEADQRAELDGATADGMSAVYLTGAYRFVTPCHTAVVGLRASQVCPACNGDLRKPVETAIPLICGHYAVVDFPSGDRLVPCPHCGQPSIVNAERVITTRYLAREPSHSEQLRFLGLQT